LTQAELESFDVWAADAEIKVFGEDGKLVERMAPPASRFHRGEVSGHPDSLVYISVIGDRAEGLITVADRRFVIDSHAHRVVVQEPSIIDVPGDGSRFLCDARRLWSVPALDRVPRKAVDYFTPLRSSVTCAAFVFVARTLIGSST
jgi:hypothetical protein